jgi:hypothetical protein
MLLLRRELLTETLHLLMQASIIIGKGGVYVIQRSADVVAGESADNFDSDRDRTTASFQQKATNTVFTSFREAAQIEDNRYDRR